MTKFIFRSSVITEITAVDHLLYSHLTVSNSGAQAAMEELGPSHPLRRLLKPFTYRANKINDQASRALFAEGGLVDRTFAFSRDNVAPYFETMSANFKFRTVPDFIEGTGVTTDDSHVFHDMERLWKVFRDFTGEFLDLHYESDEAVLNDERVVKYWEHLNNKTRTYKYGLPRQVSKAALADQLAHHMFWCTGMHKLVGNVADWLRTGVRGFSTVLHEDSETGATILESDIQYYFVASTVAGFTGMPQVNLINDWSHLFTTGPEAAVVEKWQDALLVLSDTINEDNQNRAFPSNYLNPRYLDSSVAI